MSLVMPWSDKRENLLAFSYLLKKAHQSNDKYNSPPPFKKKQGPWKTHKTCQKKQKKHEKKKSLNNGQHTINRYICCSLLYGSSIFLNNKTAQYTG